MAEFALRSVCLNRDDTQDVETYDGSLGVTPAFVKSCEKPVGLLHWIARLPQKFSAPGDLPGVVNDLPWGTGALISNDLFLTAGHCFDPFAGPQFPSHNGTFINAFDAAKLMFVRFNFQVDGQSGGRTDRRYVPGRGAPGVWNVAQGRLRPSSGSAPTRRESCRARSTERSPWRRWI